MSYQEKVDFIRQNRNLSSDELSATTGLNRRQVRKILEQVQTDGRPAAVAPQGQTTDRGLWAWAILPVILTFLAYLPVWNNQFVNWDDNYAVQENAFIRFINATSLHWMFTTFYMGNWIPLTWLSLSLDHHLGGLDPRVFHLDNLFLHLMNTLLVFFIGYRLFRLVRSHSEPPGEARSLPWALASAFLAALLFGLHPVHVESVAWAAERKDVLCGFFFLLSLLVYLDYAADSLKRKWKWGTSLGFYLLALLAKPMAVTLPIVLLLLDAWPLRRLATDRAKALMEKIPFLAASLSSGVLTVMAQAQSETIQTWSLDLRVMNAFHSLAFYLQKLAVPLNLSAFYPTPTESFSSANLLSCLLAVAISIASYWYRKRFPFLLLGWLFFVVTLVPVLGILQVGGQAAADRYAYLPSLGPILVLSGVPASWFARRRWLGAFLAALLVLGLGFGTARQVDTWKDSVSLWSHAVAIYPDQSAVILANLANAYQSAGRFDDAIREYDQALVLEPARPTAHNGRGATLVEKGRTEEAIAEFKTAISLNPRAAAPHMNLWKLYDRLGKRDEALREAQEAVRLQPDPESYNALGMSYGNQSDYDRSIEAFQQALELDPHDVNYMVNLATTYKRAGRYDEAIELYRKGLVVDPRNPVYWMFLGNTYLLKGMFPEAIEVMRKAADLQPQNSAIYRALGEAYQKSGDNADAAENFEKAKSLSANLVR